MSVTCPVCKTELRVTAMTAAGVTRTCQCGLTTMTQLSQGKLDVVPEGQSETDVPGGGQPGC